MIKSSVSRILQREILLLHVLEQISRASDRSASMIILFQLNHLAAPEEDVTGLNKTREAIGY